MKPSRPAASSTERPVQQSGIHEALLNPVLGENLDNVQHELHGALLNPVLRENLEDV